MQSPLLALIDHAYEYIRIDRMLTNISLNPTIRIRLAASKQTH